MVWERKSLPDSHIRRERPSTPSAHMALTRPVVPPDGSFILGDAIPLRASFRGAKAEHEKGEFRFAACLCTLDNKQGFPQNIRTTFS